MAKVPSSRIDRLLSSMGYCSRNEAQRLCRMGLVTLDGRALRDATDRITLDPDLPNRMMIEGEPLDPLPGMVVMMNKALGVTCSHKEQGPLIYDALPRRWRGREPLLSTVGRLDKETSGLILLTDDGDLLHRIISPKKHVAKTYHAVLARPLTGDEVAVFAAGSLMLEGEKTPLKPATLEIITPQEARLTIVEGRYHQVRRMFAAVGNHVEALHRERLGGLRLPDDLATGAWRLLDASEIAAIFAPAQS